MSFSSNRKYGSILDDIMWLDNHSDKLCHYIICVMGCQSPVCGGFICRLSELILVLAAYIMCLAKICVHAMSWN